MRLICPARNARVRHFAEAQIWNEDYEPREKAKGNYELDRRKMP